MSDDDPDARYCIVRFRWNLPGGEIIETGLSLAEAQAHCHRRDTHGEGWFDGYDLESNRPRAIRDYETEQMT
jgi:hypothetical protein